MSREKLRRAALPPVQERNRRKPEELNAGKKVNSRKVKNQLIRISIWDYIFNSHLSFFFMVRKEKLGDRITALHQLLSPFGKVHGDYASFG
ncbi:uncharacterized protein [Gossypium hirsutum]|uniref:Uncharacterized protein isoform X2 n=2 Tax=Gossypium TaxID=3633 RepID=A0ABM2ZZP2_GOSHI|nr:uncharacterized protein LOC107903836 isoform X2 [Gossypium hirsutum]XP_040948072.1 uncharacterized protein LOC107903836 isoform X2 [Gossypium hirsutum]XP_040948073.1 uncharacterized protein LOC107903836 isoform X2 [Gossypium hirsutum]